MVNTQNLNWERKKEMQSKQNPSQDLMEEAKEENQNLQPSKKV